MESLKLLQAPNHQGRESTASLAFIRTVERAHASPPTTHSPELVQPDAGEPAVMNTTDSAVLAYNTHAFTFPVAGLGVPPE
jgi:hypothetical protein